MNDGDRFCQNCGTPAAHLPLNAESTVEEINSPSTASNAVPSARHLSKGVLIGIISAAAAAIITFIVLLTSCVPRIDQSSWRSTVDSYMNAFRRKDTDAMMSMLPMDYFCGEHNVTERQLHDELETVFRTYDSYIRFGSVSYAIDGYTPLDSDRIDDLNRDYAFYSIGSLQMITDAVRVRVRLSIPLSSGYTESTTSTFLVLQIGGKWYLYEPVGVF